MSKFKKIITLQTIGSKIILAAMVGVMAFSAITQIIVSSTLRDAEMANVLEKEESDISYMEDYLSKDHWNVKDYTLYKGDTLIGDGSIENANVGPFEYLERQTGTFFFTFLHVDYTKPLVLQGVQQKKDSKYLRVAGSTKDPNGNSIVQTYMEPNVSAELEKDGEYIDVARVEGGLFHCLYRVISDASGNIIGAIVAGRSVKDLNNKIVDANFRIVLFIFIGFLLLITLLSVVIVRFVRKLKKSQNYLEQIAKGTFPENPLVIKGRDEIKEMATIINEMTASLRDKERIETELYLAKDIQLNMLPKSFENLAKLGYVNVFASMEPAREVGGDFYDFFVVDDKNIAFIVADVSGKGVPAALLMAIAKTMMKNLIMSGFSIGECFSRINNILSEGNENALFITAWGAIFNIETGVLSYSNAGHNPPLIYRKDEKYEYLKSPAGFVLGGLEGIKYKEYSVVLNKGDRILLYTDGVTEAHNPKNKLYGEDRLQEFLNLNKDKKIEDIIESLKGDIKKFANGVDQSDDITIFMLDFINKKEIIGVTKTFVAEQDGLYPCIDFVNEELDKSNCLPKVKNQVALVVEEIFMNVVNHGYISIKGDIEVTVDIKDDEMTLIFKDRGVPFNPLLREEPDINLSSEEREIGGLGIFITKKMMDEVTYDFANGQNILTIKKRIKE